MNIHKTIVVVILNKAGYGNKLIDYLEGEVISSASFLVYNAMSAYRKKSKNVVFLKPTTKGFKDSEINHTHKR